MSLPRSLIIATRQSQLALIQAELIRQALSAVLRRQQSDLPIELLPLQTTGDRITDRSLLEIGGKGLFTKEIEAALMEGRAHIAMHSLKDMPAQQPPGLMLAGVLEREDYRDALVAPSEGVTLETLSAGAVLGTSSPRRAAQIMRLRPDLRLTGLRGNVPTRIAKIERGEADATLLAAAGLNRLGLQRHIRTLLTPEQMLPAPGQGLIALQCREDAEELRALIVEATPAADWAQCQAERALLARIEGDCHTPLAGLAQITNTGLLRVRGRILSEDGARAAEVERTGPLADAARLGSETGEELRAAAPRVWD